jgi:hypothetical protein
MWQLKGHDLNANMIFFSVMIYENNIVIQHDDYFSSFKILVFTCNKAYQVHKKSHFSILASSSKWSIK